MPVIAVSPIASVGAVTSASAIPSAGPLGGAPRIAATRRAKAALLAGLMGVCAAASTLAQSVPPFGLFRGQGNVVLGTAVLNNSRQSLDELTAQALSAAIGKSAAPTPPPAAALPPPTLTYEPDARLSDWTRARMIDALDPDNDPKLRRQIEQAFAGNAVLKNFDRFMSDRGYSSHDLADDTAELLLVSWQIATNDTATHSQAAGVHEQVRSVLLAAPQMQTLTESDRQLMGEQLAYQIVITSSVNTESLRHNDAAQQRRLRESATQILRAHGVDAAQVHLTDQGFRR